MLPTGQFRHKRGNFGLKAYKKSNWLELAKMSIFPVLFISNAAGIIANTLKAPLFSAMKASYFLNSMPAFAVFLGNGVMACEKRHILKWAMIIIFGTLFILVSGHILHNLFIFAWINTSMVTGANPF